MSKRDLFILIIKLFGLTSVITILFGSLPSNIYYATFDLDTYSIIFIIVSLLISVGLFIALVFMSGKLVDLLRLDRGFDDDMIKVDNLKSADIVKIAVFIIGGLLILDNLPAFLSHSFFAFKYHVTDRGYDTQDKFYWAVSAANLVLGYLLLTNYSFVSKWFSSSEQSEL